MSLTQTRTRTQIRTGSGTRGVVRIDISARKQTHGWQARVYSGKTTRTRFFSDSKYGGRDSAHAAAAEAVQRMEQGRGWE